MTLLIFYGIFSRTEVKATANGTGIMKKIFGYVLVMSVCLFANSYFKTQAAGYLDSATLYPLNQGASLILSSVMSATLFRERLTPKCIVGLLIAFAGLIVLNVL